MYKICFNKTENPDGLREMVRMFLPLSAYEIISDKSWNEGEGLTAGDLLIRIPDEIYDKNDGKRYLYDTLSRYTGKRPDWGILTGVRPVKLTGDLIRRFGSEQSAHQFLTGDYRLTNEKADLLLSTWNTQQEMRIDPSEKAVGLYIGIPFCPTRCVYCSFPSYQVSDDEMRRYLSALQKELEFVGNAMSKNGSYAESIYIGGGTPTTFAEKELLHLLETVGTCFDLSGLREYTVEAGRPDTVTTEKLQIIKRNGAGRISINPQSMKAETLRLIGREHSPADIVKAFEMARESGFGSINMDLIAGLPQEEESDFIDSLEKVIDLRPENITVHTLAVKRASRLKTVDADYNYHQGQKVGKMLEKGAELLNKAGYRPYYLYRQKQMTGNFENVGYALPGKESLYNIRVMEEDQTVIAMGAGGISKIRSSQDSKIRRVPNVSNYEIYIEKIDEMIERKRKGIFS